MLHLLDDLVHLWAVTSENSKYLTSFKMMRSHKRCLLNRPLITPFHTFGQMWEFANNIVLKEYHIFERPLFAFQWMRARWTSDPCYAFYGVDGSDCSFLIYLSEVEWFCPPLAWRNQTATPTLKPPPKRQVTSMCLWLVFNSTTPHLTEGGGNRNKGQGNSLT